MFASLCFSDLKKPLAFAAMLTFCAAPAFAKTLSFPEKGEAMFQITIPDNWEPQADDDDVLEAESPKEHIQLSIWELATADDAQNLGKDIVGMLDDYATKIKLDGEPQEIHPGGMDGWLFKGDAVDKEDGHAIDFFALLVGAKTRAAVVFIQADANTPEKEAKKLEAILKSISVAGDKRPLRAALALDQNSKPTTTFTPDAPTIYAFYVGEALENGDEIKGVWFAEDVGDAAAKNSLIDQARTLTAKSATDTGAFTLSRPANGWPVGTYRVEIYVNDKLAETLKFTVTAE